MNKHQDVEIPKILPQKKDQIKLKTKQKDSEPLFKQSFLMFKQHYTYFHIFFHPHISKKYK